MGATLPLLLPPSLTPTIHDRIILSSRRLTFSCIDRPTKSPRSFNTRHFDISILFPSLASCPFIDGLTVIPGSRRGVSTFASATTTSAETVIHRTILSRYLFYLRLSVHHTRHPIESNSILTSIIPT